MEATFNKISPQSHHLLADYQAVLGATSIEQLQKSAKGLQRIKIVEINSTAQGGGVAELLASQIPLCKMLNLDIDWYVLPPDEQFFSITKELHNRLQGTGSTQDELDLDYYRQYLASLANDLPEADLYILHDPQTLGLAPYITDKPMIWRCHIDLTDADAASFEWLQGYYRYFSKLIFSLDGYARGADHQKTSIIQPAIDPLSDKNKELSEPEVAKIMNDLGLSSTAPFILQASRFDKFKNPLGVLELYAAIQQQIPDVECILAGDYATDDPEGAEYYHTVQRSADELTSGKVRFVIGETGVQINALQRAASVVIQNSTREGFGLTVTEALWKKKVVFTRPVGGITTQIIDGQNGFYLTDDIADNARKITDVITNPGKFTAVGEAARTHVANNFVLPLMLNDYLQTYAEAIIWLGLIYRLEFSAIGWHAMVDIKSLKLNIGAVVTNNGGPFGIQNNFW